MALCKGVEPSVRGVQRGMHSRPALVCLDLSGCDFEELGVLLGALSSLARLRSLLLEGTPCSLGRSYPGLALELLPGLASLDQQWISLEERHRVRGMAPLLRSAGVRECARATVHVGRLRGLSDPQQNQVQNQDQDFSHYVSYDFISHSHHTQNIRSGSKDGADTVESEQSRGAEVSSHSSSRLSWSEDMDFRDSHSHSVYDLQTLRSFLRRGMCVRLHEEKIVSRPAVSEDTVIPKSGTKGVKAKDAAAAPASTKEKERKKRVAPELVHEPPVRRELGSVLVPLHALLQSGHKVALWCDFGPMQPGTPPQSETGKDEGKKGKKDKKEEAKKGESVKKTTTAKGKERSVKEAADAGAWCPPERLTLELSVELQRWQSTDELREELALRE